MSFVPALLQEWLRIVASSDASDLHLGAGRPPAMRSRGELVHIAPEELTPDQAQAICMELTPEKRHRELQEQGSADFGFGFEEDRYRASVFRQKGTYALVLRRIPQNRLSFDEIGAPADTPFVVADANDPASLKAMAQEMGDQRRMTLCRELTKTYEQIVTGVIPEVLKKVVSGEVPAKGEFVLVVSGSDDVVVTEADSILQALLTELPPSKAASIAATLTEHSKSILYERALVLKESS